jgi:CubicO group peptidase (beta-lactamase class C family)
MKKILTALAIIILLAAVGLLITGNGYVFKTLVYNYPDIDDLETFDKRIVNDGVKDTWPISRKYNKILLPSQADSENVRNESVEFLVVKHDSIIYEQYWDGYDQKSISNSFSVAKSIVGILTGIAIDEKLISPEDQVGKFLPAFSDTPNSSLKIIDLLKMSSGLNWDESYQSLFSKTTEAYYGTNLQSEVEKLKVIEPPGKIFRYMSCNSLILGMIISKASGMTLSEYASEKLWKQIGASSPAYWSLDHEGG